ncbi:hypothetical protein KBD45_03470 [Candidatus Dojkabacteria bacterium]|nr:hypothetical protein [Candidatus Dojkabacteria bacterium]
MINLEKGERLVSDETLVVFEGGEYNDFDLVLVAKENEDKPIYQFQACFIKNGENI